MISCYRKLLEIDPNNADLHFSLGMSLYGLGKIEEAIKFYKKSFAIEPHRANVLIGLGVASDDLGRKEEAI